MSAGYVSPMQGDAGALGGKAYALVRLAQAGFDVPDGFVVTPRACQAALLALAGTGQEREPVRLGDLRAGPEVCRAVRAAMARLPGPPAALAVRSSMPEEDGARHSFAGVFESHLRVAPDDVIARVESVWRSAFAADAQAYRLARSVETLPALPAVLVQRMLRPSASGIAFGRDPATGADIVTVAAVSGTGEHLASGTDAGEIWRVDAAGQIVEAPDAPLLRPTDAAAIAGTVRRAAAALGAPQDIEWALEDARLILLQARPLTTGNAAVRAERVFDASNIGESYGGVVAPLTFSFAARSFAAAYRRLCTLAGVPDAEIEALGPEFERMLAQIDGRMYYQLDSWYRLLGLLPFADAARAAMARMIGAAGTPAGIGEAPGRPGRLIRARVAALLLAPYFGFARKVRRFRADVNAALAQIAPHPAELDALALADAYRTLESTLVARWDAPLLNDLYTMVWSGIVRALAARWAGNGAALALLSPAPEPSGPAAALDALARAAATDPVLVEALASGDAGLIAALLHRQPRLRDDIQSYIERFGERCPEELKLESVPFGQDPMPLYRAIGAMAALPARTPEHAPAGSPAEAALADVPSRIHRALMRFAATEAGARLSDRERLRYERTRVFGRVRRIFQALGTRLFQAGRLAHPRDVFYLTVNEVLCAVDTGLGAEALAGIATQRRRRWAALATASPPATRLAGTDPASAVPAAGTGPIDGSDSRRGSGCAPGRVEAAVRIVTDPGAARPRAGEILVARHTDPGWLVLLPLAAGLVVERGNVLSHAAVLARELAVPAVIGIDGACAWLQDGDRVRLDGIDGTVERIESVERVNRAEHAA